MGNVNLSLEEENKKMASYRCPRYEEFLHKKMYMEQLIIELDLFLAPFKVIGEEKIITATMVNNYVKHGIIPPPINKKYSENHIVYLYVIGILKSVLSISDIGTFIKMQIFQYPLDIAYNFFTIELENALKATFETRDFSDANSEKEKTPLSRLVRSALLSFANKVYVRKNLQNNI